MIAGRFAFQGLSEYLTLEKIKSMQYSFPEGFDEEAKDLVEKLLVRNTSQTVFHISPQPSPFIQYLFLFFTYDVDS